MDRVNYETHQLNKSMYAQNQIDSKHTPTQANRSMECPNNSKYAGESLSSLKYDFKELSDKQSQAYEKGDIKEAKKIEKEMNEKAKQIEKMQEKQLNNSQQRSR